MINYPDRLWIMEQELVLKFFIHKTKEWYHHSSVWHQESSFPGGYELFTIVKCFCRCWRSTCCWWPCPTRLRGSLPWKILMVRDWTDWPRLYSLNHERNGRCVWETSRLLTTAKVIIGYYAKSKFWHVALGSPKWQVGGGRIVGELCWTGCVATCDSCSSTIAQYFIAFHCCSMFMWRCTTITLNGGNFLQRLWNSTLRLVNDQWLFNQLTSYSWMHL